MIVLGIDPGTTRIGYGAIRVSSNSLTHVASGILETETYQNDAERLREISIALEKLIVDINPEKVGVERLFFSKNKKTALAVAEARGVILGMVAKKHILLYELTPNEVKLAVTGNGDSSKRAVAKMVSLLLHINVDGFLDDATDALAIAIASANTRLS
ncbi:MAG: crossover junction endodeoxyribonuclease RuvC [Patescibacteria group bacterium]